MPKTSRPPVEYPKPEQVDKPAITRSVAAMTFDQAAYRFNALSSAKALTDSEVFEFKLIVMKDRRISEARFWHLHQINEWRPGLMQNEVKELSWLTVHLGKSPDKWQNLNLGDTEQGWQVGRSTKVDF